MTPTSLIIVADRGSLKAYKVEKTPNRGPALRLVQSINITDAQGRYQDKVTDQAGRLPAGDAGSGRHMNVIAERQGLDDDNDRRMFRELAEAVSQVVREEGDEGWSFAAPASIHSAIVEDLPAAISERIVEHVKSDLVNIEAAALPSHFRSLQPI